MCPPKRPSVSSRPARPEKTEAEVRAQQEAARDKAMEEERSRQRLRPGRSQTFGPAGVAGALVGQVNDMPNTLG